MRRQSMGEVYTAATWMPYTDEDEAMTTRSVLASRAASTTLSVPVTLTALVASGSCTERGTDGRAARWIMPLAPYVAAWVCA